MRKYFLSYNYQFSLSKIILFIGLCFIGIIPLLKLFFIDNFPKYQRFILTRNLSCDIYFQSSEEAINLTKSHAQFRIKFSDPNETNYPTDCLSIKKRGYYPEIAESKIEAEYPLAFGRIVYKDYVFLETMFRIEYAPQNIFCYVIDVKADPLFKKRVQNLQTCFPDNVHISKINISIDSAGHGMSAAFFSCLETIKHRNYKYIFLLQNYDVKMKTNREFVEILSRFQGANDVSATEPPNKPAENSNFSFPALNIFRNASKNLLKNAKNETMALIPTASLVQVSISKAAVDYMLNELNLTTFINTIEKASYGMDELFMATLNANSNLGLPGGFTNACIKKGVLSRTITRYTAWDADEGHCNSKLKRHSMCVFGMEDLLRIRLKYYFYANKMAQDYDFGAVDCLAEKIFNLTYKESFKQYFDYEFYEELAVVRYNKWKNLKRDVNQFRCQL